MSEDDSRDVHGGAVAADVQPRWTSLDDSRCYASVE